MENHSWFEELPVAITVSDASGNLIEMNDLARNTFGFTEDEYKSINMLDCHPEPARSKLIELMNHQQSNIYTIEKNGAKKMIIQIPWYTEGSYQGHVEISVSLPETVPHFIRKKE